MLSSPWQADGSPRALIEPLLKEAFDSKGRLRECVGRIARPSEHRAVRREKQVRQVPSLLDHITELVMQLVGE